MYVTDGISSFTLFLSKSTLIKIIAGLLSNSSGSVEYLSNGEKISQDNLKGQSGFVAPYYNLFNQITAFENVEVFNQSLNTPLSKESILKLFNDFQLSKKENYKLRQYSSGMKQRLRLLIATMNNPTFLLMDEPNTNLDVQLTHAGVDFDSLRIGNGTNLADVSNNKELETADILDNGWLDTTISVTAGTPKEIKVGGSAKANRKMALIQPLDGKIKFGFSASTQNFELFKRQFAEFDAGPGTAIWVDAVSGTVSVAVGEAS